MPVFRVDNLQSKENSRTCNGAQMIDFNQPLRCSGSWPLLVNNISTHKHVVGIASKTFSDLEQKQHQWVVLVDLLLPQINEN